MLNQKDKPALLLIDIQKGFDDITYWGGERNNLNAEANAKIILDLWRDLDLPVFHIRHCSTNPVSPLLAGQIGNDFKNWIQVSEPRIRNK